MISQPHYHVITWKDSKHYGTLQKCPSRRCCLMPAYSNDEMPEELLV